MSTPRRKAWDDLKPTYRRRLERSGVTRESYTSGASLSAARGHSATPERPQRAEHTPDRYRGYLRRRGKGMRVVTTEGVQIVQGLSQREKSTVGSHDNAVRNYLGRGGEIPSRYTAQLSQFKGKSVSGYLPGSDDLVRFWLETRENYIDLRESRGDIRFESVYESRP